eukprot:3052088-Rhodomonas_salina.1
MIILRFAHWRLTRVHWQIPASFRLVGMITVTLRRLQPEQGRWAARIMILLPCTAGHKLPVTVSSDGHSVRVT